MKEETQSLIRHRLEQAEDSIKEERLLQNSLQSSIRLSKIDQKVMAEGVWLGQEASNLRRQSAGKGQKKLANKEKIRIQKRARQVLRCGIARHLTGDAYREFSC